VRTTPLDVAQHLRTPEEMAEYLDAWLEEAPDDAAGIARAIGQVARAVGMNQLARELDVSRENLYDALGEESDLAVVVRIARDLGSKLRAGSE
jgi:probable addiction module antidote protein